MRKIIAIYNNFFTSDGKQESIGGIQTYLRNLLPYFIESGYSVELHQMADINFEKEYKGVTVFGHVITSKKLRKQDKELYLVAAKNADFKNDILLFGTSTNMVKNNFEKSIAIQHGITWDTPRHQEYSHRRNLIHIFLKALLAFRTISDMDKVKCIVCVDYNYVNWYRTQIAYSDVKIYTIPNFTDVPAVKFSKENSIVNIIFARRLQQYRGTRLFTETITRIINEYPDVRITIAGSGPDEKYMREELKEFSQVHFIQYDSSDSLQIHKEQDIAVVPTVGSEGTSLSLLEAMASGCAVVCTDVGGMTNIIINRYNGRMVRSGDAEQLYVALKELIDNPIQREQMAIRGYETVKYAFSYERWTEQWREILKNID